MCKARQSACSAACPKIAKNEEPIYDAPKILYNPLVAFLWRNIK